MRIAQDTSANVTNVRHLENRVGPRRTGRAQPIASLENVYVGKEFSVYMEPIKPLFVRSFCFQLENASSYTARRAQI